MPTVRIVAGGTKGKRRDRKTFKKVRRKKMTRKATKRVAKSAALSLKETKKHQVTSTAGIETWNNSTKWLIFQPLALDKSSTDSETQRESNNIYAMNSRLRIDIETNPISIHAYHLRFVMGWAKGAADYSTHHTPLEQLTAGNLGAAVPNYYSDFDKDDFKINYDRLIRVTPRQIFDSSSGTSVSEDAGLTNDNRGLWPQISRNFNFKFGRKMHYEGSMASELSGWVPFIAIQLDRTKFGDAHTGATGSNPSPNLAYELTTYFKDIV